MRAISRFRDFEPQAATQANIANPAALRRMLENRGVTDPADAGYAWWRDPDRPPDAPQVGRPSYDQPFQAREVTAEELAESEAGRRAAIERMRARRQAESPDGEEGELV